MKCGEKDIVFQPTPGREENATSGASNRWAARSELAAVLLPPGLYGLLLPVRLFPVWKNHFQACSKTKK
jgi:hypothetical protein